MGADILSSEPGEKSSSSLIGAVLALTEAVFISAEDLVLVFALGC